MSKNQVQRGEVLTAIAPGNVDSGDGVLIGACFGVAQYDALTGAEVELAIEGVFALNKVAGAINFGAPIYWATGTVNGTTGTLIGFCARAAGASDPTCDVRLTPNGVAVTAGG